MKNMDRERTKIQELADYFKENKAEVDKLILAGKSLKYIRRFIPVEGDIATICQAFRDTHNGQTFSKYKEQLDEARDRRYMEEAIKSGLIETFRHGKVLAEKERHEDGLDNVIYYKVVFGRR